MNSFLRFDIIILICDTLLPKQQVFFGGSD